MIPQTPDERKGPQEIFPCLLRGLPFEAGQEEIGALFEGYNMVEGSVKVKLTEAGRNSGLAAVLFKNSEALQIAFEEK